MKEKLWLEFVTLSLYTLFMGFCFCDGFGLHIARKLVWFFVFFTLCIYSLSKLNEFDLTIILPVSLVLALLLCFFEKRESRKKSA